MYFLKKLIFKGDNWKIVLFFLFLLIFILIIIIQKEVIETADSIDYLILANQIKNLDFSKYYAIRTPGYPLLIFITLQDKTILLIVQIILHFINVSLIYKILHDVTNNAKLSFTAAVSYLFFSYATTCTRALMSETLATTLLMCSIYYLFKSIKDKKVLFFYFSGFFASLAAFTRPLYVLLPAILLLGIYFYFKIVKIKKIFLTIFIQFIASFVLIFTLMTFNYYRVGKFTITNLLGFNLTNTIGNCIEHKDDKYSYERDVYISEREYRKKEYGEHNYLHTIWPVMNKLFNSGNYSISQLSDIYFNISIMTIIEHPMCYFKSFIKGFYLFWWPINDRDFLNFNKIYSNISCIFWAFINIMFLFSIFLLKKYNKISTSINYFIKIIIIFILTASISQALLEHGDNTRFAIPTVPLIILYDAIFYYSLLSKRSLTVD